LTEEGWWPVTFRRLTAVLSLDLGGLQSLLAESRVCERHIEGPHPLDPLPRSPPTGLVAVCRPSWRCGWSLCQGHRGVHWNVTVLEPSVLVRMSETARWDPLFMQ
jgi:hypothetical protein